MSENQKRYQFHSQHDQLLIMRSPVEKTRSVNGVMQIVMEDQIPFSFENGNLVVHTKKEAEELRANRMFGVKFHEVPASVLKVAENKAKQAAQGEPKEPEDTGAETAEPQETLQTTEVPGVSSFNEAMAYFKEELGLDHKQVNSKDKINALTETYAIVFPDYPLEEDE